MSFTLPKLCTGYDAYLFLRVAFQVCVTNVGAPELEFVQFSKECDLAESMQNVNQSKLTGARHSVNFVVALQEREEAEVVVL